MRPQISKLIRETLYPHLIDGKNVSKHPPLQGFAENVWFIDHNHLENSSESVSYSNAFEADMVLELVKYAVRNGYSPQNLAVITPYVGQLLLIRKKMMNSKMMIFIGEADREEINKRGEEIKDGDEEDASSEEYKEDMAEKNESDGIDDRPIVESVANRVRLATVDNFQGEEADLVIVSTVRCNKKGRTGYLTKITLLPNSYLILVF